MTQLDGRWIGGREAVGPIRQASGERGCEHCSSEGRTSVRCQLHRALQTSGIFGGGLDPLENATLLVHRGNRNRHSPDTRQADRREVDTLRRVAFCLSRSEGIGDPGQQIRVNGPIPDSGTEHVVLVDTVVDLAFPHPSSSELVSVAAFI